MHSLIVGDIHGCFDELQALLDACPLSAGDQVVAVGDLVDRGPRSADVLRQFGWSPDSLQRDASAAILHAGITFRSVLGNHERKHIRCARGLLTPAPSQLLCRAQFGDADYPLAVAFMDTLPRFLRLDDALVIHGFLQPGVAIEQQDERFLTGVMGAEYWFRRNLAGPWYEEVDQPVPVIFGHHDHLGNGEPLIARTRHGALVYGIDTSCCHGGWLTGLLLPELRVVRVRARQDHWKVALSRWKPPPDTSARQKLLEVPSMQWSWKQIEELRSWASQAGHDVPGLPEAAAAADDLCRRADDLLAPVVVAWVRECEAIVAELREQRGFDALPTDRARYQLFSQRIEGHAHPQHLLAARAGRLSAAWLKRRYRGPWEVVRSLEPHT